MAVAIRGTTPATAGSGADPTSVSLTGTRQPQTDDVLVIIYGNDFYAASNIPTPTVGGSTSGVNLITNGSADGGTDLAHVKSWTKVITSTGDLTVSVDETGSADEEKGLAVYVLSGVDTGTPIDVAGNATGASSTSWVAPSISPTSSDAFLICHANSGAGTGHGPTTPPGGMTESYDFDSATVMGVVGATEQLSASGATGTRTFTSTTAGAWGAISIAVNADAGGPPPAFPVVEATNESAQTGTASTTHTVNLPASIAAGDLLLVLINKGRAVAPWSFDALTGWTELLDEAVAGGCYVAYRWADGTEGATIALTGALDRSAHISYRISGAENPATQAPEISAVATGTSQVPNPNTVTPTGGAKDYLWLTFFGTTSAEEADDDTWLNNAATNYASQLAKTTGTGGTNVGACIGVSTRTNNAASEDAVWPAASIDVSMGWRAFTIAVHPATVAEAAPPRPVVETDAAVRTSVRQHHGPGTTVVTRAPVSGLVTGTMAVTQADQTMAATGTITSPPVTGTMAVTQDSQTMASSGQLGYSGSFAETQDDQTMAASGTLGYSGALAETQDDQVMAASGQLGYSGTFAEVQDDQVMTASGTVTAPPITGTFAETQDHQTMAASGTVVAPVSAARVVVVVVADQTAQRLRRQAFAAFVGLGPPLVATEDIVGTFAETQDNQTMAASGTVTSPPVTGSLAETQDDQTMSASGTVTISGIAGSLAETQDDQTMAASGQLGYSGLMAVVQANQTMSASGTVTPPAVTGTFARTQANQTMSATGTVTGPVTGTMVRTQADQTMTATGWITVTGTMAAVQANQTMSAAGVATDPPTGFEPVATFIPPLIQGNPLEGAQPHRLNRLMRYVGNWAQGATVWKDSQGIWHEDHTPYQGGATHDVHNLWSNGVGPTSTYSAPDEGLATAQRVYLGGHVYQITAEEVAELTAAGYAANITPLT